MIEIVYTLVVTHITIVCVTLFLHRGQAHRSLIFSPVLSHFMRFWLWLTTGMRTKEWVAVHRKHHRYSDVVGDPHSPRVYGLWKVFPFGVILYSRSVRDRELVKQYSVGVVDDYIERVLYTPHAFVGILIMLLIDFLLFSYWGFLIWAVQMIWIPFWAAGVINGIGHYFGYRNDETRDHSRNIVPWGIMIGGEELHNNHHINPASAKLSMRWYEFDIGWLYIRIFKSLRLLSVR
jgi:stearoyl-CoA desaturase (delta-9 desaturase)